MSCKHKNKHIVDMKIIDYAKVVNAVNTEGVTPIVCTGEYEVYRCLDCKCLVWEEKG